MMLLDWAVYYATAYNWYVFPIVPRGKHPATAHGFNDATNDPDAVAARWTREYNIGVDCGRSNLAVIDLDGPEGIAEWDTLQVNLPPRSAMVQYTGGGGAHIIYRQPALVEIRNTAGKIAKHIDTRGVGGYILLSPSIHPSGNAYRWSAGQDDFEAMGTFPPELLPLLQPPPTPTLSAPTQPLANPNRILQKSYERIANASEGNRNETINKAAWYLFGLARDGKLNESDVTETILQGARRCGYPERETLAVLRSVAAKR